MRPLDVAVMAAALTALLVGLLYPATVPPVRPDPPPGGVVTTDARTHAAVVERIRSGERYYDALGDELRQHNYPTRSPFNWRTPLHLSALALAPWIVWRGLLTTLLVAFYAAAMMVVRVKSAAWAANFLSIGVLVVSAASDAIVIPEAWAGAFIGLSACAFALDRRAVGVGLALIALFMRELAAPYCVICTLTAAWERRWKEVAAWGAGALAYFGYFAWHATQVLAHRTPTDIAHSDSWVSFLGVPFLQATLLKVGWFAILPTWLSSVALALLAAGVLADETPRHFRVASAAFVMFFLIAGLPFNSYWGFLAAPVWAITCGYGVGAISEAVAALSVSSSAPA
jgi:hypothetical protein